MHRELYKQNISSSERQELRRQKLLQEQRNRRLEQQDELRELPLLQRKESNGRSKYKKHNFQDLYGTEISLQFSEWMKEKPENLAEWFLVPCPKGQRCLVVSARGRTKMFSKNGRHRMSFKSILPGGGASVRSAGGFSILDCVYNEDMGAFYVLDVLWYGKQSFLDCEAQFRFFWLKSKFEELQEEEEYNTKNIENIKQFFLLESCDMCNDESIARALQCYPLWAENQPQLDGFLFYHKESSYTCGSTPLVCWLFPFMVNDVLQMSVSNQYEIPPNYSTPLFYMEEFDREMARKRQKWQSKKMDCSNDTDSLNSSICSNSQTNTGGMDYLKEELGERAEQQNTTEDMMMGGKQVDSLQHIMNAERLLELEGIAEL
ncbi:snurportin-1 [Stomoxys calcitrans]|uniref:snurportin-1 n=1 Tax=Stomoxys calcitrans TaxID=35570 RepID=UPI0027E26A8B|nr:snurportin-1 [Stomoxys calcitrans]